MGLLQIAKGGDRGSCQKTITFRILCAKCSSPLTLEHRNDKISVVNCVVFKLIIKDRYGIFSFFFTIGI